VVYLSLGMGMACAPTRIGIAPQVSGPVVELVDNQHVQDDLLLEVGRRRCQHALDELGPQLAPAPLMLAIRRVCSPSGISTEPSGIVETADTGASCRIGR
jgi:hypothetical protein